MLSRDTRDARTVRYQGRLSDWNDASGFGFVVPNGGGTRSFVHIQAFERRGGRRPRDGDAITYETATDARGRVSAVRIHAVRATVPGARRGAAHAAPWLPRRWLGAGALLAIVGAAASGRVPWWLAVCYLGCSAAALLLYGIDKSAAQRGQWRTPEATLQLLALAGGWPGALFAQGQFRHKSRKTSFQFVFWAAVLLNLFALAWLLLAADAQALRNLLSA
ncbi:hypothetical protein HEP74_02482 [Xanthomonas sp. SS]|nr:cold shock and DUF1294 domain-containing protein [Xanthomonas sp. SS]QNH17332.1 hypothetical protein HEP74_02482 [Xanthomonas sp. SS]